MSKFVVVLSILFLAICSNVYGEIASDKEVVFDPEFGGLHAKEVIFNTVDAQRFDVMLSTVHSLTFLIDDNDCKDPDPQKESDEFCHLHKRKYKLKQNKAGDTRKGDPKPLQEKDLTEKGQTVEDKIQLGSVQIETKFGIMNSKVEEDPKFWGIKRFKEEGENKGKVEKGNKAEGCLSLLPGKPEFETDFGDKTPMETLITSDALLFKIVSIQLGKVDQVPENTLAQGKITFGSLAVNDQCHSWNLATKGTMDPWNLQIDALEGVEEVKGKNAIIDTSSEQITVPKNAWEKLNALVKEGECDPTKLSPLKFTIGGLEYAVPATHYLKKTKEGCVRLLAQNFDDLDQKLHLGLPFMRSTCVGADLQGNKVYLSEGVCKKEGGGEKPPTPGGDEHKNGASSMMGMAFSTLMAFVFLAITAIIIH